MQEIYFPGLPKGSLTESFHWDEMMPFGNSKVCLMRFKDLGVVIRHIAFGGLIKSVKVDSKLVHIHGNNLRLWLQIFPLTCSAWGSCLFWISPNLAVGGRGLRGGVIFANLETWRSGSCQVKHRHAATWRQIKIWVDSFLRASSLTNCTGKELDCWQIFWSGGRDCPETQFFISPLRIDLAGGVDYVLCPK